MLDIYIMTTLSIVFFTFGFLILKKNVPVFVPCKEILNQKNRFFGGYFIFLGIITIIPLCILLILYTGIFLQ